MDKKIYEVIDMNDITTNILKDDLTALNNIKNFGYEIPDYFDNALIELKSAKDATQIVDMMGTLFDRLAKEGQFDLAIIMQQFVQRYAYFAATNNDYLNYASTISANVLNGNTLGEIFTAIYTPFFSKQIDFYCSNFLENLNLSKLKDWNEEFYQLLKKEVETILTTQDFLVKLETMEQFIAKWTNPELLYNGIGIDFENPDAEKELLATQFNEFKMTLQSIDIMIERVINKIKQEIN